MKLVDTSGTERVNIGKVKFKKGCQPRIGLVQYEQGRLLTYSLSVGNMRKNHFCQLFWNARWLSDDRQTEIHIVERFVSDCSAFQVAILLRS